MPSLKNSEINYQLVYFLCATYIRWIKSIHVPDILALLNYPRARNQRRKQEGGGDRRRRQGGPLIIRSISAYNAEHENRRNETRITGDGLYEPQ